MIEKIVSMLAAHHDIGLKKKELMLVVTESEYEEFLKRRESGFKFQSWKYRYSNISTDILPNTQTYSYTGYMIHFLIVKD